MAALHDDDLVFPARDPHAACGSDQWKKDNRAELAHRPQVLPLNQRARWTPAELATITENVKAGMTRDAAVRAVVEARIASASAQGVPPHIISTELR